MLIEAYHVESHPVPLAIDHLPPPNPVPIGTVQFIGRIDAGRTEQERIDIAIHLLLEHIPAPPDPSMWQAEKISVDDDDLGAPSVENTAEGYRIWFASSN